MKKNGISLGISALPYKQLEQETQMDVQYMLREELEKARTPNERRNWGLAIQTNAKKVMALQDEISEIVNKNKKLIKLKFKKNKK